MKVNKTVLITIGAVVAAIIMTVVGLFSVYGKAVSYEENVTEAKSAIKVQEKRRADLLPTLADAIKAYDKHEYETFIDSVKARTQKDGTITDEAKTEINNMIDVVVEKYPDLKSNENYKEFMKESSITENKIAETRESYNKMVTRYNTYTRQPLRKFVFSLTGYEIVKFEKLTYDVSEDAPKNLFD